MFLTHRSFWITPLIIAALLSLLVLLFSRGRLRRIYTSQLADPKRERVFLASIGFFVAVLVVRGITIAIHHDIGPFHNVEMGGRHIHHLVWGICLILTVGYLWLLEIGTGLPGSARWSARVTPLLFGVGAALTLDEFALWLNLRDVYWQRQGRESYEAMGLFGSLLSASVFGGPLFRCIAKEVSAVFGPKQGRQPDGPAC